EMASHLLGAFDERSQRFARKSLESRGVEVRTGIAVKRITTTSITLDTGEELSTRCLIWAAGVQASTIASVLGVEQGRGGRIVVEPDLSIPDHPNAFAIGDIADIDDGHGGRLPQLAQVAIQGGQHAAAQA